MSLREGRRPRLIDKLEAEAVREKLEKTDQEVKKIIKKKSRKN